MGWDGGHGHDARRLYSLVKQKQEASAAEHAKKLLFTHDMPLQQMTLGEQAWPK
jgi:hypothetical protein